MKTLKAPKQVLEYLDKPETFDRKTFETAIRNEVEVVRGELSPTESLLVGMLVMTVETLMQAQQTIKAEGYIYHYNAGEAISAHMKVRTECLDKVVKLLRELDILTRTSKKASEVDELFAID
jgi:hypothetical protein